MNSRLILLTLLVFDGLLLRCARPTEKEQQTSDESLYTGSIACKNCHERVYQDHLSAPHHLTSQLPNSVSIKGSFEEENNIFFYSPQLYVVMSNAHNIFSQSLYSHGKKVKTKSFDLVFGSGVRGQTYLTWQDSSLLQLPIGYLTSVNMWANSPGFSNRPIFNRPITGRCLECHSTFFKKVLPEKRPEHFSKKNFMLGIECEKCHGAGKKHVDFQQENRQLKEGKYIISFKNFSQKQQLDFCRSCHGGKLIAKKPPFTFKAGSDLNEFFNTDSVKTLATPLDSHGNQYGMLSQSKCFLQSNMTCLTCHQVHENEKGKTEVFSKRCMNCHTSGTKSFCSFKKLTTTQLQQNCIQCHMPEKNSNSIRMLLQGEDAPTPARMHVHHITTYPDEVVKYLQSIPMSKD
ncbi:MAG: hypothetical protein JST43_07840 [Bacteroidetes bacterium]|nr:hypothetical protein [Bacteroidota bacterium]MBS1539156.1 hypothetical protein [Bacteroidota bacterium]